jgi:type II secretory pathway pseudopilin PulG
VIPAKPGIRRFNPTPRAERGYVLLTLLLLVTLVVIAAAAAGPGIAFQIKREREEELVHRGVQYSRAVRLYAKSTGRYPFRLEDLNNTSQLRFLRKLYKDPITGKDFKMLHMADIPLLGNIGTPNLRLTPAGSEGGAASDAADPSASEQSPVNAASTGLPSGAPSGAAASPAPGQDIANRNGVHDYGTGGVIFGVASTSKAKSIREFNHKNHYDQWLFFYDPNRDRGAQITGPTPLTLPPALPGQSVGGSATPLPGQAVTGSAQTQSPRAPTPAQQ